jgi:ferric-dicitrate binding protein FerR (iron transport regulator)
VAKDVSRPFILHSSTIDIRVLGTSFNVQCYGNEKNTEASLFQGSIEVTLKNIPDKKIILRPSEKLIVHNNEMVVSDIKTKETDPDDEPLMTLGKVHYQQKDSSYIESLWTKNQLAFDDRSLEEVAKQIEHWYGVHVTITDQKLKAASFSGVFEDETLTQVMNALKLIGDFHYSIHNKEVIITP